jgi:hypothetical protein
VGGRLSGEASFHKRLGENFEELSIFHFSSFVVHLSLPGARNSAMTNEQRTMKNEKCPDDYTTKFPHLLMSYEMWHILAMSGGIKYLYAARIAVPAGSSRG